MFFNKKSKQNEERLEQALVLEKFFNPEKIRPVIKNDIINILKNYSDFNENNLYFDIVITADGFYELQVKAKLNRIKVFNSF